MISEQSKNKDLCLQIQSSSYPQKNPLFNHKKNYELQFHPHTTQKQFVKRSEANKWSYKLEIKRNPNNDPVDIDGLHMKKLLQALASSKTIKVLNLDFSRPYRFSFDMFGGASSSGFPITPEHFEQLTETLKRLPCLQDLTLNLSKCSAADNLGLFNLGECLRRIPSLKKVDIDFSQCKQITAPGLFYLFDGLKRLPYLETLKLSFVMYSSLSH